MGLWAQIWEKSDEFMDDKVEVIGIILSLIWSR